MGLADIFRTIVLHSGLSRLTPDEKDLRDYISENRRILNSAPFNPVFIDWNNYDSNFNNINEIMIRYSGRFKEAFKREVDSLKHDENLVLNYGNDQY